MTIPITSVPLKEEFRVCPSCGYEDGFHTMLRTDGRRINWLFICPSCHGIFDPDLSMERPVLH